MNSFEYCDGCGTLRHEILRQPMKDDLGMAKCSYCSGENPTNSKYCMHCGRAVAAIASRDDVGLSTLCTVAKNPHRGWRLGRLELLLVGLIVVLIVNGFINRNKLTEPPTVSAPAPTDNNGTANRAETERAAKAAKMPETYARAVKLVEAGNYYPALLLLQEVQQLDPNYKDVAVYLNKAAIPVASDLIAEANKLSKSTNCGAHTQAIEKLEEALRLDQRKDKIVEPLLKKVREDRLACLEGNDQLQMAIQIYKRHPVTLVVWIKNVSNRVRHANPNYFTLVTTSGESHSYSSDSFEYSKHFSAVELQPGTETSGAVVFDTDDAPRTLVYQETLGSRIARDFP